LEYQSLWKTADRGVWRVSDVVELFEDSDLHALGQAASDVKRCRFGERVTWIDNCHINYTNICGGSCSFCRYRCDAGDDDAFVLDPDDLLRQVAEAVARGAREVHIVGGLNDALEGDYYVDLIRRVRNRFADLYIKAFTAVEIDFISNRLQCTVETVLARLRDAGLDSLAGGGAEIFSRRVRQAVCPAKIGAERWLEIHRTAHMLGLRSNATMLFGHVETTAERADHLLQLRTLQSQTGGFQSFLPIPVVDFNDKYVGGIDALKTLAISRLVLDNIDHIKVFWPIWTPKLAQLALGYGADDLDGTVVRYRIVDPHHTGVIEGMPGDRICHMIEAAGYEPVERDGRYHTCDYQRTRKSIGVD